MAAVPVEISVIPSRAYRRGAGKKVKVCIIPLHTEKRIIYPPSFVIPSNPFIIEVYEYGNSTDKFTCRMEGKP